MVITLDIALEMYTHVFSTLEKWVQRNSRGKEEKNLKLNRPKFS